MKILLSMITSKLGQLTGLDNTLVSIDKDWIKKQREYLDHLLVKKEVDYYRVRDILP